MGIKKQTIGYRYFFSLHMGLGRGPINEIAEIRVGDVPVFDSACVAADGGLILIDKPEAFGGDTKEGGIQGPMYIYNGARDQELQPAISTPLGTLPSIADSLGGDVPNFRGVVTCWFDGLVCALNPYPKEWSFRVRRTYAGWFDDDCWYRDKVTITLSTEDGKYIRAMNGAHILYEINTNPEWGRGMPTDVIDENSYTRAANQLCEEGFGLCIPWFRQETLKEFIPVIINHIGGIQYVDRETGKMTLRLLRGDYVEADLPVFSPDTGLLDLQDDDSSGEDTAFNEIIVKGFDPTTKQDISVRVHNLASIQSLGEIISNTIEYNGLPTRKLVARVAERELKMQLPLRKFTAIFDRRAWRIAPGMPFRITFPAKGIENMVVRAGDISDSTLDDGKITIKIMQDVFAMPSTSYVTPTPPQWVPPDFTPAPVSDSRLMEANWRDFYRRADTATRDDFTGESGAIVEIASPPVGVQSQEYDLATRAEGEEFQILVTGGYTQHVLLDSDIGYYDTTLVIAAEHQTAFFQEYVPGMAALIDDEQIELTSYDDETATFTIKRGVTDTIIAPHIAGAKIWLIDDEMVSDGREYTIGETVHTKVLTRTSTAVLSIDDAEDEEIDIQGRLVRPYPPGAITVDGIPAYSLAEEHPEPEFGFEPRNRLVQGDQLVGHDEPSTGLEDSQTTVIRIYDVTGTTLLRTADAGAFTTWTYDSTMQGEDGNPGIIVVEIEANRDDLASFYHYRFSVVIDGGWNYDWGNNWGS